MLRILRCVFSHTLYSGAFLIKKTPSLYNKLTKNQNNEGGHRICQNNYIIKAWGLPLDIKLDMEKTKLYIDNKTQVFERVNRKIKLMFENAYGYSNFRRARNRIMYSHNKNARVINNPLIPVKREFVRKKR